MRVFLVDNGSLRPAAWINLCQVARALSERLEREVEPASVLHSTRIDPGLVPDSWPRPTTWERATRAALAAGEREFLVLPFFFGPTGAIVDYLPARRARLAESYGDFSVRFAPFLGDALPGSTIDLVEILAARVRERWAELGVDRTPVVLVDHGSPRPDVTALRDRLGPELARRLGGQIDVRVASMERREGAEFDFNEPLLERALRDTSLPAGPLVVAMLFLSPGRHAGPGGDVVGICEAAEAERPGLRACMTDLVGSHPGVIELLADRFAVARSGS